MKPTLSATDSLLSVESSEFLWNGRGTSDVHSLVLRPILEALRAQKASRVLDIGCGNGSVCAILASEGFEVTGIDASASGIEWARRQNSTVRFEQHDISEPLPPWMRSQFDAVIAIEVVEHLFKPRDLFWRASEALRQDGLILVTTPYHGYLKNLAIAIAGRFDNHVHPLRDYGHIKFFSEQTLRELVEETGFSVEAIRRVGRIPPFAKSMILSGRFKKGVPCKRPSEPSNSPMS